MNAILCILPILLTVISVINCLPYANDYPHQKYSYASGNLNDEREEGADIARSFKNEQLDTGNDLKSAQDISKFSNTENSSKEHDVANIKQGSTVDINKHTVGENLETDKSHNRKQVKSGFHNSYSKDETGNNSSFYEDSDDRGGKLVYNKRHKHGDDTYDSKFNDRYRDGVVADKRDDRFGGYDKRGRQDREHLVTENQGDRMINRDGFVRGKDERYALYDDQREYPQRRYLGEERYGINRRYDPSERQFERPIDNVYDRRLDRTVDRGFDRTLESPIRPPMSGSSYRSSVGVCGIYFSSINLDFCYLDFFLFFSSYLYRDTIITSIHHVYHLYLLRP